MRRQHEVLNMAENLIQQYPEKASTFLKVGPKKIVCEIKSKVTNFRVVAHAREFSSALAALRRKVGTNVCRWKLRSFRWP